VANRNESEMIAMADSIQLDGCPRILLLEVLSAREGLLTTTCSSRLLEARLFDEAEAFSPLGAIAAVDQGPCARAAHRDQFYMRHGNGQILCRKGGRGEKGQTG
jgi:hypothetical protein